MSNKSFSYPDAIILCGGRGERLRPLTKNIPKPLVKINNLPILHYVIEHLIKYKIIDIHIASGYKSHSIKQYLLNSNYFANIKLYNSGDVDIIKRLQDILVKVKNDVIVLYGDTISNININQLINRHKKSSKEITMTVWPLKIPYGIVEIGDNELVESFVEKPILNKWINIGYFYINSNYRKKLFNHNNFEKFLFNAAKYKAMNAYKHLGLHITVNTLSELEEAQKNIKNILKDEE